MPESYTLVSATPSPHVAVAQVGLLVLFASLLLVLRSRSTRYAVVVAIAGTLLVCISHPFLVLSVMTEPRTLCRTTPMAHPT